jgi:hypothetical protein
MVPDTFTTPEVDGASDQCAACWAGFVSRSAASIVKGRRLKSMMKINEDMVSLLV